MNSVNRAASALALPLRPTRCWLAVGAIVALAWTASACDKSKESAGGDKPSAATKAPPTAPVQPAAGATNPAPTKATGPGQSAAPPAGGGPPTTPPTPTKPPLPRDPVGAAGDGAPVAPTPGGRALAGSPLAGMDLATASQGVLTGDLKFGETPTAAEPASSAVDKNRHKLCQQLLDCTREAVKLAPSAVTNYETTLESVDSLEANEAAAECGGDLKDLRQILAHEGHKLPTACK